MNEVVGAAGEAVVGVAEVAQYGNRKAVLQEYISHNRAKYSNDVQFMKTTLRDCGYIAYGKDDPANKCMEMFLNKSVDVWDFDLGELFAVDKGARERVFSECARRSLGLLTLKEKQTAAELAGPRVLSKEVLDRNLAQASRANLPGTGVLSSEALDKKLQAAIDPIITIFQKNYSTLRWWGALGTFPVRFEVGSRSVDGARVSVRLSGENRYDWHPSDNARDTQELHAMASKLVELGEAKPFTMRAKPVTFFVNTTTRSLEDQTVWFDAFQHNPASQKEGGQIRRWVEKRF